MPTTCQAQNEGKAKKVLTGWDRAIADAQERIKSLKLSIDVFKEHKKAGEPWPGDKSITI